MVVYGVSITYGNHKFVLSCLLCCCFVLSLKGVYVTNFDKNVIHKSCIVLINFLAVFESHIVDGVRESNMPV